ncbi:hypothetical protein ACOMHN_008097 [Nucella lapillus]
MAPTNSKKKGSKSRSTSTKVTNKTLNKFAKQGKLRKQRLKQKKKENKLSSKRGEKEAAARTGKGEFHEDDEIVKDVLQEEDIEFYGSQDASFTSRILSSRKNRKRKNEESDDDSSKYEKKARLQFPGESNQRMKMLLPIKDKGKVIPKMMELEDSEEEEEDLPVPQTLQNGGDDSTVDKEQDDEPLPQLSAEEMVMHRERKLANRKQRIAELATAVIENPEDNITKMKELRKLLGEKDPDVCLTVRKLVMVSMCEVFKDVIPGYRLRLPSAQEKEQRMKQETKQLMDYESALLLSYKTYLEFLEHIIKGKSFGSSLRLKRLGFCDVPLPEECKKDLMVVAVQCMSALLTTHPHFNYRSDVITFLVPYMNDKNTQVSDIVCRAAKHLFAVDKSGEVTLEVVRGIAKLVKSRKFNAQPKVLQTLLCLKIKEINTERQPSNKMKRKEKFQKLSRRERKRFKQSEELENELKETKATQDKELRLKMHTQTVETMFTMFFNVLKQEERSPLISVVLEALAKFTHLISVDFFHDLYAVFNKLIESEALSQVETLHCVQTAFRILSGQGVALNIDPLKFYTHLYTALLHIHAGCSPDDAASILDTVDAAIIRRKKQVTQQRVLAFVKRLSTMSLHQLPQASAAFLAMARCMVSMFPYADILYDQEACSSGVYMPFLQEPEHCHASSAVLWELHSLKKHFHPDVKRLANALLHKSAANQGDLSHKTPPELYSYIQNQELFPVSLPKQCSKHTKVVAGGFRSQEFEAELQGKYPDLFSH